MSDRSSKFGDFMAGLVIGALAGSVVALLSAPQSGDETRQMIGEKGREMRDKAVDTYYDTRDKTGKVIATGREKVEQAVSNVKDRASEMRREGESMAHERREQMSDEMRRAADRVDPNTPSI